MTVRKTGDNSNGGVAMDRKTEKRQRKREFAVGFFSGLAVIGAVALILLAIFWL